MMRLRDFTDWVWPTLAPHDSDYFEKREHQLNERIRHIRATCEGDIDRQRRCREGAHKEFQEEQERKKSTIAFLQALLALPAAVVAMFAGLSFWVAQSHTIRASAPSVILVVLLAAYPVVQFVGAFLAAITGLRVRSFHPLPHVAEALADPMDVAEETMRATHFNTDQIDDLVSYKKLARRFLKNAGWGLLPLAAVLLTVAAWNLSHPPIDAGKAVP